MMKLSSSTSRDLFLRVALFALLIVSSLAATTRSRGKKKVTKEIKEVNVCDIQSQSAPMFCHCIDNGFRNTSTVTCVVLNTFKVNDPMWTYLVSQTHPTELYFVVRGVGSLDYVPTNVLAELQNLTIVSFKDAKIDELGERTFSNLPSIREINLSRNMIVVLKKYAFENMKELTAIDLDRNRIIEINRDVFVNLPNLTTLSLNTNNISIVHDKAFKHLPNLEELQLSDNQITVITRESFHGLRNLKSLNLQMNLISMIGDRSFVEMPELTQLELDSNIIEYISEKALDGMRNLKKLHLSGNRLVSLEPDFLSGAPGIYFLDLRNNNLKTMTFNNVKPIVTNLYNSTSYFYLEDTQKKCRGWDEIPIVLSIPTLSGHREILAFETTDGKEKNDIRFERFQAGAWTLVHGKLTEKDEGNKLICDCNLAWIWGLMNETKNSKLRDALEELTCFLESNNTELKINNEDLERNQELGIARNPGSYLVDNLKNGNEDDEDRYLSDLADKRYDESENENEDSASDNNSQPKMLIVEGKVCYVKHLFDLKLEELPCPETTREDLMASEQPSSRHENAPVGSSGSIWFSSSTEAHRIDRYLLASSLILLLPLPTISSLIFT